MKYIWGALACVLGACAVVLLIPSAFPILKPYFLTTPLAQLIAIRSVMMIVLAVFAVLLLVVALIRRLVVNRGRIAGALAAVLLIVAFLNGGITLSRGIDSAQHVGNDPGITEHSMGDGSLTVMNYNTLGGQTSAEEVAGLMKEYGVDVVSLPETSTQRGNEIRESLERVGLYFQQFDTGTSIYTAEFQSTVLLVSRELGDYESIDLGDVPASIVAARPVSGSGPTLIVAHPIAPIPSLINQWRTGQEAIYGMCSTFDNFVMAGDFNSTIDHQDLFGAQCADGAIEGNGGSLGTWPSALPRMLAVPIDRVLHSGNTYRGSSVKIVKVGDSDHRGIIVRLTPR